MSLSIGFDIARSSLSTNAERASIASRNIAAANDPSASRKRADLVGLDGGGATLSTVERAVDTALTHRVRTSVTQLAEHRAVLDGLSTLNQINGEPGDGISSAELIARLRNDLATFASVPQDRGAAMAALSTAGELANTLNAATRTVERVRSTADAGIANGVRDLNRLLGEFEHVNHEIVSGKIVDHDVSDAQDRRDGIISEISNLVGVRTIMRDYDDAVIITDGGLTLFETSARSISFQPSGTLTAGNQGEPVIVDGVRLTKQGAWGVSESGSLVGMLSVRDELAPAVQSQLDEMARGLIASFAESDQTGGGAPDQPGLFTYSGATAVPPDGAIIQGLAGAITIHANVDPDVGGNIWLLRDGGIADAGGATYLQNTLGAASFSDRLDHLSQALSETRSFDATAGLQTSVGTISFAEQSVAWMSEQRSQANLQTENASAISINAQAALSRATGINLDEEMLLMLEVERSYQATTRLISTIDQMYNELFSAVR